jgi:restriction system protein
MAIPDFQSLTLPVLREFGDGLEHSTKDIRQRVAEGLRLRTDELAEMLPSGGQTRFANRVAWAHVYMKQAGLLTSIRRGVYRITPRGAEVLASPPDQITMQFLERYPEYLNFRARQASVDVTPSENCQAIQPSGANQLY